MQCFVSERFVQITTQPRLKSAIQVLVRHVLFIVVAADQTYSPDEVLSSICGYVEHFLGCRQCARNFLNGAARLLDSGESSTRYRRRRDGAVMWLWQAHNRANSFLSGDATEDPSHPKVQFPSRQSCSQCYIATNDNNETAWNEGEVLKFLQTYYGASHVIDDDIHDGFNMGNSASSACNNHLLASNHYANLVPIFVFINLLGASCWRRMHVH
jgi:Erv1 / Alr family